MNLSERLNKLVGHSVSIDISVEGEEAYSIKGILEEVGKDYVTIIVWDSIGGFPIGGQCFIKIDRAVPIIHTGDCRRCPG